MNTATTASHVQRESAIRRQSVAAAGGGAANGWFFPEIASRLPGPELRNLDVGALKRLLREAERIAANTNLTLRMTTGRSATLPTRSRVRTARRQNRYPKTARST